MMSVLPPKSHNFCSWGGEGAAAKLAPPRSPRARTPMTTTRSPGDGLLLQLI